MGLYDTFFDGKKSVQLKNFNPNLRAYKKGDKIQHYGNYPKDAFFFCFAIPEDIVLVQDKKFIKIMGREEALKKAIRENIRVFDCQSQEYSVGIIKVKRYSKKIGMRKKGEKRVI
jgi:hypothetical protein